MDLLTPRNTKSSRNPEPGQEAMLGTPKSEADIGETMQDMAEVEEPSAEVEVAAASSPESALEVAEMNAEATTTDPVAPTDDAEMDDFAPGGMGEDEESAVE